MVRIHDTLMSNPILTSLQAVTTVLDSAGSALNSRSNEPLDLEARDRRKFIKLHLSPRLVQTNNTNIIHSQENVTGAATPAQS